MSDDKDGKEIALALSTLGGALDNLDAKARKLQKDLGPTEKAARRLAALGGGPTANAQTGGNWTVSARGVVSAPNGGGANIGAPPPAGPANGGGSTFSGKPSKAVVSRPSFNGFSSPTMGAEGGSATSVVPRPQFSALAQQQPSSAQLVVAQGAGAGQNGGNVKWGQVALGAAQFATFGAQTAFALMPDAALGVERQKMAYISSYGTNNTARQQRTTMRNAIGNGITGANSDMQAAMVAVNNLRITSQEQTQLGSVAKWAQGYGIDNAQAVQDALGVYQGQSSNNLLNYAGVATTNPDGSDKPLDQIVKETYANQFRGQFTGPDGQKKLAQYLRSGMYDLTSMFGSAAPEAQKMLLEMNQAENMGKQWSADPNSDYQRAIGKQDSPMASQGTLLAAENNKTEAGTDASAAGYDAANKAMTLFTDATTAAYKALGPFADALQQAKGALYAYNNSATGQSITQAGGGIWNTVKGLGNILGGLGGGLASGVVGKMLLNRLFGGGGGGMLGNLFRGGPGSGGGGGGMGDFLGRAGSFFRKASDSSDGFLSNLFRQAQKGAAWLRNKTGAPGDPLDMVKGKDGVWRAPGVGGEGWLGGLRDFGKNALNKVKGIKGVGGLLDSLKGIKGLGSLLKGPAKAVAGKAGPIAAIGAALWGGYDVLHAKGGIKGKMQELYKQINEQFNFAGPLGDWAQKQVFKYQFGMSEQQAKQAVDASQSLRTRGFDWAVQGLPGDGQQWSGTPYASDNVAPDPTGSAAPGTTDKGKGSPGKGTQPAQPPAQTKNATQPAQPPAQTKNATQPAQPPAQTKNATQLKQKSDTPKQQTKTSQIKKARSASGPLTAALAPGKVIKSVWDGVKNTVMKALSNPNKAASSNNSSSGTSGGTSGGSSGTSTPYDPNNGAEQWRTTVTDVLKALGIDAKYVDGVLGQMNQESSGNPNAVNDNDSNWQKGIASWGLMQTIASTYNTYAPPGKSGPIVQRNVTNSATGETRPQEFVEGMLDPYNNIYAGVNYASHKQGENLLDLWLSGSHPAYSEGAYRIPKDQVANLHANEMVLPADVAESFRKVVAEQRTGQSPSSGGTVNINVTLNGSSQADAEQLVNVVVEQIQRHFDVAAVTSA